MQWADAVRETTASTGSGAFVVDGAYRGHQTFLSGVGNDVSFYYCRRHRSANLFEVAIGVLTGGTTITPTKVLAGSSGAGVSVTFTEGTSDVFLTEPATVADGASQLKRRCRVVCLTNVTIATALNAGDTINGVVLAANDRVLLVGQTTVSENGIYVVGVSPSRSVDLFTGAQASGVIVPVMASTTFGNILWQCTAAIGSDIVGTNSLTWSKVGSGTGGATGPETTTLNSLARWDSTDGTTLEDSELIVYPESNDKLQTNAMFMAWPEVTDGATVVFDFDESDKAVVEYGGNRTLSATNVSVGQKIVLLRRQDGTGNRVETWFSNISWDNGMAPVQDPTAAGWDTVVLECTSLDAYSVPEWVEISRTSSAPRKGISETTYGATTTFDFRVSPKRSVVMTGNPTLEVTANSFYKGMTVAVGLIQDGTGSRTATWGTSWGTINWLANGGSEPTLSSAAGSECWVCLLCTADGVSPEWVCVGVAGSDSYSISDAAYGVGWNAVIDIAPSKNAVYDKFEAMESAYTAAIAAAVVGLLDDKGNQDCSANPNYPSASKGDVYTVSVAGKIGGASGVTVEVGDVFRALADNAGGTQAAVGSSWAVVQANLVGALVSGGALGTPSSGTLSSCTGLPVAGISGLASGIAAFLATPSSANLAAAVTDETGGTALVFSNSPVITTPKIIGTSSSNTLIVCPTGSLNAEYFVVSNDGGYPILNWFAKQNGAGAWAFTHPTLNAMQLAGYNGGLAIRTSSSTNTGYESAATFVDLMTWQPEVVKVIGDLCVGTTSAPTANHGKVIVLGDNGATDPTLAASTCAIYQKSGEIYHKDAAGNVTLTSPHAIDEAMEAGIDIPDDDMHPSIGKSYNQYTGWGAYTYRNQVVSFEIPAEEKRDWTESQLAAALAREQERFEYEVAKAIHAEGDIEKPFDRVKPVDYVPSDPPQWLQRRGVATVDRKRVADAVSEIKAELTAEVPVRVEQFRAEKLAAEQLAAEEAAKNTSGR